MPPTIILGNKCDLPQPHAVRLETAQERSAKKWQNIPVIETSAINNTNIEEAFLQLITIALGSNKTTQTNNEGSCCEIQ